MCLYSVQSIQKLWSIQTVIVSKWNFQIGYVSRHDCKVLVNLVTEVYFVLTCFRFFPFP